LFCFPSLGIICGLDFLYIFYINDFICSFLYFFLHFNLILSAILGHLIITFHYILKSLVLWSPFSIVFIFKMVLSFFFIIHISVLSFKIYYLNLFMFSNICLSIILNCCMLIVQNNEFQCDIFIHAYKVLDHICPFTLSSSSHFPLVLFLFPHNHPYSLCIFEKILDSTSERYLSF
jgi:hypothetical protein